MLNVSLLNLGAPGIYRYPEVPLYGLTGVRMDVCGFAGVAPRGPARQLVVDETLDRPGMNGVRQRTVAVAVESFDEYRRMYGGFEGPGLLPYAVASFFEQGGRRAYIARIVHKYKDDADNAGGVAEGKLAGFASNVVLQARSEGTWGNVLRAWVNFHTRPIDFISATKARMQLLDHASLWVGTLLRLTLDDGTQAFRHVAAAAEVPDATMPRLLQEVEFSIALSDKPVAAEIVEAVLDIDDGDGRAERFEGLGLAPDHPRWMAAVLIKESNLVYPHQDWEMAWLQPADIDLKPVAASEVQFQEGLDRYPDIARDDFFDEGWRPENEEAADGVQAFSQVPEIAALAAPDLFCYQPLPSNDASAWVTSLAGSEFTPCVDIQPAPEPTVKALDLAGLQVDALANFDEIVEDQNQLIQFAEQLGTLVVLLDVPPGLNTQKIRQWRARVSSSYGAAYHPWLTSARPDDQRDRLVRIPPSAVAAGVIAAREQAFGIAYGPANVIAQGVVNVDDAVSPARHAEMHQQGINVYLQERDGIVLSAARTLSADQAYRQLSVRRLMIMLRLALERQMQWAVFEPNGPALQAQIRHLVTDYLRSLYQAGAFRGASEREAFFVRCDEVLNSPQVVDAGKLIAEIGVAPAEPMEFIVLRLTRDGDGTLLLKE